VVNDRRFIWLPVVAFLVALAGVARAQDLSPVPYLDGPASVGFGGRPSLGSGAQPAVGSSVYPGDCMSEFTPLRYEAEKRAELLRTASARHAPADEACVLIVSFARSELKMLRFLQGNEGRCGIPRQLIERVTAGHTKTEAMRQSVCPLRRPRNQFIDIIGDPVWWPPER
jgi:hypothetical protein